MDEEQKYITLLEESTAAIYSSQLEIEDLKRQGKYPPKDYAKTKLDISLSLANLSASKLNYNASKKLIESLSKSSRIQRYLTGAIIIIGGFNLLLAIYKLICN